MKENRLDLMKLSLRDRLMRYLLVGKIISLKHEKFPSLHPCRSSERTCAFYSLFLRKICKEAHFHSSDGQLCLGVFPFEKETSRLIL